MDRTIPSNTRVLILRGPTGSGKTELRRALKGPFKKDSTLLDLDQTKS